MVFFSPWTYVQPLRRIFIRDLILEARIGIYEFEQNQLQNIQINVSIGIIEHSERGIDELSRTVSYEDIVDKVKKIVRESSFRLVETLAETLIENIMIDKRIIVSRISVEKLDIIPETKGVGVEIERWQSVKKKHNYQ